MAIDYDSLMTFLISWGTPTFMVVRAYIKMDSDDRESVKEDFTSRHFIFTLGFLTVGFFIASVGNLLDLNIIKYIGIILLIVAGITITVDMWGTNKIKSVLIPICLTVAIFFIL